tara:strand:+ start:100 stop:573 length:474 start_codon:yes stop_codon:yes gene_type:complete
MICLLVIVVIVGCVPTEEPIDEPVENESIDETVAESCEDGLLNQDEEQIDCGGICADCPAKVISETIEDSLEVTDVAEVSNGCTDSDVDESHPDGLNPDIKGVVEAHEKDGTPHTLRDSCYTGNVFEYFCENGTSASKELECEFGCRKGICWDGIIE